MTYTSLNPGIATVTKEGKVTAISKGTASILVTSVADVAIQRVITITVSEPTVSTPNLTPSQPNNSGSTSTPSQSDNQDSASTPSTPSTNPTYTGDSDVQWAASNGWYIGNGRDGAYLNEISEIGSFDSDKADFFAMYGADGIDMRLAIYGYYGDYKTKIDNLIWRILPSSGGTLISKLNSGNAGTFQWDGRKVYVEKTGYGWFIEFYAKY